MRTSFPLFTVVSGQALWFPAFSLGTRRRHRKLIWKLPYLPKQGHNLNLLGSSTIHPVWSGASWITALSIWSQALPLRKDQCCKSGFTDIYTIEAQPEDPHQNGFSEPSQKLFLLEPCINPWSSEPSAGSQGTFLGGKEHHKSSDNKHGLAKIRANGAAHLVLVQLPISCQRHPRLCPSRS